MPRAEAAAYDQSGPRRLRAERDDIDFMNEPHVRVRTPEQVDLRFALAGIGTRALAQLIDWLLLLALAAVVIGVLAAVGWLQASDRCSRTRPGSPSC